MVRLWAVTGQGFPYTLTVTSSSSDNSRCGGSHDRHSQVLGGRGPGLVLYSQRPLCFWYVDPAGSGPHTCARACGVPGTSAALALRPRPCPHGAPVVVSGDQPEGERLGEPGVSGTSGRWAQEGGAPASRLLRLHRAARGEPRLILCGYPE